MRSAERDAGEEQGDDPADDGQEDDPGHRRDAEAEEPRGQRLRPGSRGEPQAEKGAPKEAAARMTAGLRIRPPRKSRRTPTPATPSSTQGSIPLQSPEIAAAMSGSTSRPRRHRRGLRCPRRRHRARSRGWELGSSDWMTGMERPYGE